MRTRRPPVPRDRKPWTPNSVPQLAFLATSVDEALYGGAAGGGKSASLLAWPLRWVGNPNFRGLYLRREAAYLGNAIDKSKALYPLGGGQLTRSPRLVWTFPSGAEIWFGHCQHPDDVANYDSFEFNYIAFDELTHFTREQYAGICARLRTSDPTLPTLARAGTNPGGRGHEWVFARWAAWLDPSYPRPAAPGEPRWFLGDEEVPEGTRFAISRTFVPARAEDNPALDHDKYGAKLAQLDPVRRAQLRDGNWLVKPAAGLYFRQVWFPVLEVRPTRVRARVRYWDLAAGGDWAVGLLYSELLDGGFVIEHVERIRGTPAVVRAAVRRIAEKDGDAVPVYIEQDPGQAGKDQIFSYVGWLPDREVRGRPKRVDKITAAGPASSQAEVHNISYVRGHWNDEFFAVLEAFPEGETDDDVDALSGAHAVLIGAVDRGAVEPPPVVDLEERWDTSGRGF